MLYREVPKNGDKLSILGYGCMRFPIKRKSIDEPVAEKQILHAIERGVNYFDTAYAYHGGKSEPFLGKVLARDNCRDKVKIATKLPQWQTHSKEEMARVLDEQLTKLQTDHIDYYLIHSLDGGAWNRALDNGVIEFMNDALRQGKIINAGFSFHGLTQDFNRIVDDYDWTFCQIQYNYLDKKFQAGAPGLEYAASKDMAVIVMEPLRGGYLAKTPPPSVEALWAQADKKRSPAEWALRWILNEPDVTVVLSGMNDDVHIDENLTIAGEAQANTLTEQEMALVEQVADAYRKLMKAECTGCQYCMPCPVGVNIPACFDAYNSRYTFKEPMAKIKYLAMNGGILTGEPGLASMCSRCGECLEKCPQHLPIPDLLDDVKKNMEGIFDKPLLWLIKKVMKVKKKKR